MSFREGQAIEIETITIENKDLSEILYQSYASPESLTGSDLDRVQHWMILQYNNFLRVYLAHQSGLFLAKDVVSIRSIVTCSMSPVFYAVFPLLAAGLGLQGPALWRISSGVVAVSSTAIWSSVIISIRRWPVEERKPDSDALVLIGWLSGFLALICHTLNLVAWPWPASAGLYLLGVWLVILIAALYFVNLIFSRVL